MRKLPCKDVDILEIVLLPEASQSGCISGAQALISAIFKAGKQEREGIDTLTKGRPVGNLWATCGRLRRKWVLNLH